MAGTWDELVNAICRPPRDAYTPADLVGGISGRFTVGGRAYTREDFAVRNPRGHLLQLSLYEPAGPSSSSSSPARPWNGGSGLPPPTTTSSSSPERGRPVAPVVVYCHCNSGSRRDAEEVLHVLLPRGLAVLAFDFAGSGVSEGEYVTLGAHEVDDLAAAISALRARRGGPRLPVALWGRSMGAATALLAAAADPRIAALVLDSPFASLPDLLADLATAQRLPLPRALTRAALALMRRSVSKRAGFDVSAVAPLARAATCFAPALFGHAPGDEFIPIAHTRRLVARYAGDAACVEFEGGHNSVRPGDWYASGLAFLAAVLLDGGGGGGAPGAAAAAAATTTGTAAPAPAGPPRPFAARGGRLPVAAPSDLAAAAAFREAGPGSHGMGHAYGGPALAAAHAGSEAVGAGARGGGGRARRHAGSRAARQGEHDEGDDDDDGGAAPRDSPAALAADLRAGLAVSTGRAAAAGAAATPPRAVRDPGDVWPPGIGGVGGAWPPPSASASPSPARATAGARTPASAFTPSPVRSHFKVPSPAARQMAVTATAVTPPPGSAQRTPGGSRLTPQQAELGAFFGKAAVTPPPEARARRSGGGGHRGSPRAVAPLEAPAAGTAHARPASSERAARYAAAAAADAARAARGAAAARRSHE